MLKNILPIIAPLTICVGIVLVTYAIVMRHSIDTIAMTPLLLAGAYAFFLGITLQIGQEEIKREKNVELDKSSV